MEGPLASMQRQQTPRQQDQLADVERPVMQAESLREVAVDGGWPPLPVQLQQAREHGKDILAACAQRREAHGEAVEPRQQVGAEPPCAHDLHERLLAGHHHPHVNRHRPGLAERLYGPLLEDAQKLGLQGKRQIRDLVEQQRPAVGAAKVTGAGPIGPGEGSAAIPEQLALGQAFRERRAVDGDQRSRAPAPTMEGPGDHLLAAAGLALEHDGKVAHRRLAQRIEHRLEGPAAPEPRRDLLERRRAGGHDPHPAAQTDDVTRTNRGLGDEAAVDPNAVAASEIGDGRSRGFRAPAQDGVTS